MNGRLAQIFANCRAERRAALIVYLMAGDPDEERSLEYAKAAISGGADILEIGVPFSDPIADGPVIQAAAERSLAAGGTLVSAIRMADAISCDQPDRGVVLMSYCNPLLGWDEDRLKRAFDFTMLWQGNSSLHLGMADVLADCVDGFLPVDLDPDDDERMLPGLAANGPDRIVLISDSTPRERKIKLLSRASGFAYFVAQRGVTGERQGIPNQLIEQIHELKSLNSAKLPIAVGFGLSRPEDVHAVAQVADGVIVGSALVRMVGEGAAPEALAARVRELHDACQHPTSSNSAAKRGK